MRSGWLSRSVREVEWTEKARGVAPGPHEGRSPSNPILKKYGSSLYSIELNYAPSVAPGVAVSPFTQYILRS